MEFEKNETPKMRMANCDKAETMLKYQVWTPQIPLKLKSKKIKNVSF